MLQISMPHFDLKRVWRKSFTPIFAIGAIYAATAPSIAVADDALFLIPPITIEEQGDSEVAAKKSALSKAKKEAFSQLVDMLVPVRAKSRIPDLSDKDLEALIYTVDIPTERMSQGAGLYVADVQVGFRPDLTRQFFKRNNIAFAETRSQQLVVLPVLITGSAVQLWEASNEWRNQWTEMEFSDALVPMVQPFGELTDIGLINAEDAIDLQTEKFQKIAAKYNAGGVVLSIAELIPGTPTTTGEEQVAGISVSSLVIADGWDGGIVAYDFEKLPNQEMSEIYSKAIEVVYSGVQEAWKESNLIDPSSAGNSLVLNAPLEKIEDWIKIRSMLDGLTMVQGFDLLDISIENAHLKVTYSGRVQALRSAIAQANYKLSYTAGDQNWFLTK